MHVQVAVSSTDLSVADGRALAVAGAALLLGPQDDLGVGVSRGTVVLAVALAPDPLVW